MENEEISDEYIKMLLHSKERASKLQSMLLTEKISHKETKRKFTKLYQYLKENHSTVLNEFEKDNK